MNRFILYLFGFLILVQTNVLACNFKIANFGSPKENIKFDNNLPEPLLMPDRNLMDFAMEKYGRFNLPKGLPKKKWRGNHIWDLNLELVEYIVTDIHDGHVEIIDIVNKLYLPTIENYNEKVGEWLDSGQ